MDPKGDAKRRREFGDENRGVICLLLFHSPSVDS